MAASKQVLHEDGVGQRPDAAGHRRDGSHHPLRAGEVDVTDDAVVDHVDAHVHDGGTRLEHGTRDEAGHAGGHDDDVGGARVGGQIDRAGVTDGHGGVLAQQEQRGGLADDVAAPDDDRVLALDGDAAPLEELDRGLGGRRQEAVVPLGQQARVLGMEPVDVLGRIDGVDHPAERDVRGQWHLDDDAVHARVVVQPLDLPPQLVRGAALRELYHPPDRPDVFA